MVLVLLCLVLLRSMQFVRFTCLPLRVYLAIAFPPYVYHRYCCINVLRPLHFQYTLHFSNKSKSISRLTENYNIQTVSDAGLHKTALVYNGHTPLLPPRRAAQRRCLVRF